MSKIPWYTARASGFVAWGLLLASIVWGVLLATRVLGRRVSPAWIQSLHRYLGALALSFVGVHVIAILLDSYTSFGITDVLIPLLGSWHPLAVAWGIVGMYLLGAVEVTSLLRHRMTNATWRSIHMLSYAVFATTTIHMVTAGTDIRSLVTSSAAVLLGTAATFAAAATYLWRSDDQTARPEPASPASPHR